MYKAWWRGRAQLRHGAYYPIDQRSKIQTCSNTCRYTISSPFRGLLRRRSSHFRSSALATDTVYSFRRKRRRVDGRSISHSILPERNTRHAAIPAIYHFFSVSVGEDGVLTVSGSWTTTNRPVFRHSKTLGSVMPWGGIHGEPSVFR